MLDIGYLQSGLLVITVRFLLMEAAAIFLLCETVMFGLEAQVEQTKNRSMKQCWILYAIFENN